MRQIVVNGVRYIVEERKMDVPNPKSTTYAATQQVDIPLARARAGELEAS